MNYDEGPEWECVVLAHDPVGGGECISCDVLVLVRSPHTFLCFQARTDGEIPYVTSDYNYDISGAGKLKIKKHLQRREHRCP